MTRAAAAIKKVEKKKKKRKVWNCIRFDGIKRKKKK